MKKLLILLGLFCGLFLSCSKHGLDEKVLIMINNQTSKRLDNISIFSLSSDGQTEREKRYGSVSPGIASMYQLHEKVFSYPLFTFTMQDFGLFESREIRCGNGLWELSPGRYSMVISGENNYPIVSFIKD